MSDDLPESLRDPLKLIERGRMILDLIAQRDAFAKQVLDLQDELDTAARQIATLILTDRGSMARRIVAMLALRLRTKRRHIARLSIMPAVPEHVTEFNRGEENEAHNAYELASRILRGIDL